MATGHYFVCMDKAQLKGAGENSGMPMELTDEKTKCISTDCLFDASYCTKLATVLM